jgi:tetratricopeptide (TPR) repeat protein
MVAGEHFKWAIGGSKPVEEALPGIHALLDEWSRAHDRVNPHRDWAAGIEALGACIASAARLGLPCFVAYEHVEMADWELLRGDIQAAARHAREALQFRAIAFTPRSAHLREEFERRPDVDPSAGDAALETEHLHVYGLLMRALEAVSSTMARVLARAGDRKGALEAIGDVARFIARGDAGSATEAVTVAEILRDAGHGEEAVGVLQRAEGRAQSDDVRATILLARANALASLGRLRDASHALAEAAPHLDDARRWIAMVNMAAYFQASGLNAEALELLSSIDIDRVSRSDEDRFGYTYLRAAVLDGLGRGAEAQDAAMKAIGILEELRGGLKDLGLRASWTGKQQSAYALAVRVAAGNGDAGLAFDLCERSRSRQLVDEIAIGRSSLDDEGRRLERRLRDAEEERGLLSAVAGGGRTPRPELVLRLRELNPGLALLEVADDGSDRVSERALASARGRIEGAIARLRESIAARRVASAERLFGAIADHTQVRVLLQRTA